MFFKKPVSTGLKIIEEKLIENRTGITYTLKRSNRKSLSLKIDQSGGIFVYAPIKMDLKIVENFIFKNQSKTLI